MPRINLLPWREELRQKRKKDFVMAVLAAVIIGGGFTYVGKLTVQGRIANQNSRNATLRTEISRLDEQIEEIRGLEAQKNRLVDRMQIIDRLQRSRPEVVHLFDEIVNTLPEGVYLTRIQQRNSRVQLRGVAQSSTRVSALMRNVESSEWLRTPELGGIEGVQRRQTRNFDFELGATQVSLDEEEGAQ